VGPYAEAFKRRVAVRFGPSTQLLGAGVSKAGRPRPPMRLMISRLYLKHAYDESDEGVVERWSETPL
jgi:IS5 family transposase